MKLSFKIILFFCCIPFFAQTVTDNYKVEKFIIGNKLDSARYYFKNKNISTQKSYLKKIINKEELDYSEYYQFVSNIIKSVNLNYIELNNFINKHVKEPSNKNELNKNFFNIKWTIIAQLVDFSQLEEANLEQIKLEKYVNQFSENSNNYLWAKTKLKTYDVVMYYIEKDIKKGIQLSLECVKIAEQLEDIELQIAFLLNYAIFTLQEAERDINKYIELTEQCIKLDKKLPEHNFYYYQSVKIAVNAYIYKGGYENRIYELLDELYASHFRVSSYFLYLQMIATLEENSEGYKKILAKFNVNNVLELANKLEKLGEDQHLNDLFYLADKCAIALQKHKYYDEALAYKQKAIILTRKTYSQELSESLASFKVKQSEKEKEKEIKREKEKKNLYFIIALLALFLLTLSFITLKKFKKQSTELADKNNLIRKSLEEKKLLVKEMHHRVKNNFQLIASILELQTKGVKDKKVLELADESKNRVNSMALIHQKLYLDEKSLINFEEYIKLLVKEINAVYGNENNIEINISFKNIKLDVDTAIPLGLIINEIITNSYKYAFKDNYSNKLSITMTKDSNQYFKLITQDNGPGISETVDLQKVKSVGLRLIERLVKQLHGYIKITNSNGVRFEIDFKCLEARKLVD